MKVPGKTAMVLLHACASSESGRFSKHHHQLKSLLAEAKRIGSQPVIIMPTDAVASHPPSASELAELQTHGFKIVRAAWTEPPSASATLPVGGSCSSKSYLVLHALALNGYDAVAVYDEQAVVQHGTEHLMTCAAQKRLITTSSPSAPISSAIFAVKPNGVHYKAAMQFAADGHFSKSNSSTGSVWMDNDAGTDGEVPTSECGIGLLHALFYGDRYHADAEAVFRGLGLVNKKEGEYDLVVRPKALRLDRCTWNRHASDAAACGALETRGSSSSRHSCSNAKVSAAGAGECFP